MPRCTVRLALAVDGDDAGALLAAVLQGVQAEVGESRRLGNLRYANHAAHRSGLLCRIRGDVLHSPGNRVEIDAAERRPPAIASCPDPPDRQLPVPLADEAHRRSGNAELGGELDHAVGLGAGTGDDDAAMVLAEQEPLRVERRRHSR